MKITIKNADFSSVRIGRSHGTTIYDFSNICSEDGYFYNVGNLSVGHRILPTDLTYLVNANLNCNACMIPVESGDSIYLKVYGGNGARAWGFVDEDYYLRDEDEKAAANLDATSGITITAPRKGFLIVNNNSVNLPKASVEIKLTS